MTDPYGIIDLASLKKPTGAAAGSGGAAGSSAPGTHEVAVTEQGLEQLIADSQQIPTLLLVTSGRVSEGPTYLAALRRGVDAKQERALRAAGTTPIWRSGPNPRRSARRSTRSCFSTTISRRWSSWSTFSNGFSP